MPLQLQRSPQLAQLAAEGAWMGIKQACHLHGKRAAARDNSPGSKILPGGAQHREGIDPRMAPEPAVFILDERLQIARRHVGERDRITPDALRVGKPPQRRPVFRHHHTGRRDVMQAPVSASTASHSRKINAASQRQRRFTRGNTRIYGVTVSGPLAAPVARHCGAYIDSTCGCGT